jgi:hypothetical protein
MDLGKDESGQGRRLAWLDDDRASGSQRRRHICDDLVQGIVPGCDAYGDTYRPLDDYRVAYFFRKGVLVK